MKRLTFKIILKMTVAILMAGCLTRFDTSSEYHGGQIVISGQISPFEETSVVYVGRTADKERLPEPISGAMVTLRDDLGNEAIYAASGEKYILKDFAAVPGRTYHIHVALPGHGTFESIPEQVPAAIGVDEVNYVIEREDYTDQDGIVAERYFVKIFTDHTVHPTTDPVFIKWHAEEVYLLSPTDFPDPFGDIPPPCYIYQAVDPQRIVLFTNEEVKAPYIPDLRIASRLIDASFLERHYFIVYQSSLTREAYEYWKKADIVANQVGSIFDEPPARIKGNIFNVNNKNEEVLGYFQASNQTYHRFFLLPQDLPFRLKLHCEYRSDRSYLDYPSECLNCATARNSTYIRPPWF
ncbi:MAG TPA: DUF4249 domain-containing protein [Chryseosolibacter sp.]|nr:DUF4249 domain-containing protein [Chryseosolibacter sp.]